jgi:hypothetical protein
MRIWIDCVKVDLQLVQKKTVNRTLKRYHGGTTVGSFEHTVKSTPGSIKTDR